MSTKRNEAPLIWIDCEMTGLDVHCDELIEVAVVPTDANLKPLDAGIDLAIQPSSAALEQMNDFVRNMHEASGLLEELENGFLLAEAETIVLDYIKKYVPEPGLGLLAGNSIWSDRKFLDVYMPQVTRHLHYRMLDVSSLKELARRWYPRVFVCAPQKKGGHRALADIRESIQELEYYRRTLFPSELIPRHGAYTELAAQVAADVQQNWVG